MFKASFPRHARLGNVARRQLSTLTTLRPIRIQSLEQQQQQLSAVRASINPARLQTLLPRFYSSEATAQQTRDNASDADADAGPQLVTKFPHLSNLGVHEKLVSAITEGMKYEDMTDVQSLTINQALRGTDLVAQARTGTGKTLAFLVPVFQRLLQEHPELANRNASRRASSDDVKAIILSPTRELAEQIGVEARKLTANTGIVVQTAVGGTRKRDSLWKMQREGCHILVATPGRLEDLLSDGDAGVAAPNLKAFVLDEADRMLDVGFSDAIRNILQLLPPVSKVDRQTLLFSATIPRDVVHLAKTLVKTDNFEFVQTIRQDEAPTHEKIPQHMAPCTGYENWFPAILEIADKAREANKLDPSLAPFKAMVFFSNTATVQFAFNTFSGTELGGIGGMSIFEIHSKLTQNQRTRSAEAFRRAKSGILFSSDVTARGMDFPGVTHVIQVGLPPDRDQYIHRIGRTGRAGASGEGWILLATPEIREARSRLHGLPIKPNHSLATSKVDLSQGEPADDAAPYFREIERGYKRTRPYEFSEVYSSLLGQKFGRRLDAEDAVQLVNNWSQLGLKREEVPALSAKSVTNRGLTRVPGIRIGDVEMRPEIEQNRFGRGGFGGRGGSGARGSFGDRGGDRGGFSRGGDRGGFSRGGDRGGFSRGGDRGGFSRGGRDGNSSGGGFSRSNNRDRGGNESSFF
ncbi:putative P-loop containing nucleoside triphosphate hydrolase protein [Seiridium cardinale]|uniref:ATP-dependent RNA helicase n=1 Tax=Seiridium cardinale TaxID=138064 RepID=A0ABR2XLV5_9PEZI